MEDLSEEKYHSFLNHYAGFFFGDPFNQNLVISKLRLGPERTTDFVVTNDQYSLGLTFELIELEVPQCGPYTQKGNLSSRLSTAIEQIQNWRRWIKENRSEAKRLFPSIGKRYYNNANFRFTIIIGNRKNSEEWLERRNDLGLELKIAIRSFDSLTDRLKHRVFLNGTKSFSAEEDRLSYNQRNRLANPFYTAYSDPTWREIVRRMEHNTHFVALNADAILENRTYNDGYSKFAKKYRTDGSAGTTTVHEA